MPTHAHRGRSPHAPPAQATPPPESTAPSTNAVKRFKYELRGKRRLHRTPRQLQRLACRRGPEGEIAAVGPSAIVALDSTAAHSLMQRPVRVMSERGRWLAREDGRRGLVTVHPSTLLRCEPAGRTGAGVRARAGRPRADASKALV